MADNPSWLGGAANTTEPMAGGTAAPSKSVSTSGGSGIVGKKALINNVISFANMAFAVLLAACGALGVGSANSINDTGIIFVGLYMVLFGIILFLFELNAIKPMDFLESIYKKNFGFLYGPKGKGSFLFL